MIGEFLLTSDERDNDENDGEMTVEFRSDGGEIRWPYCVSSSAASNQRSHLDLFQKLLHLQPPPSSSVDGVGSSRPRMYRHCARTLIQGPEKSGKTRAIQDWAVTLASFCAHARVCCPQCQSHPETCRCNDVDVILCRPNNSANTNDPTLLFPSFQKHSNDNNNNNTTTTTNDDDFLASRHELLILHRIRIHTVYTRRQYLSLLIKLQGRPIQEQPRRGIFVDDLHRLVEADDSNHDPGIPLDQRDLVLSQLVAILVDTSQWLVHASLRLHQTATNTENTTTSGVFLLAVTISSGMSKRRCAWSKTLLPHHLQLASNNQNNNTTPAS